LFHVRSGLSLERLLRSVLWTGVDAAAQLLTAHRAAGRVLVIGDFDADGATSTALTVRSLARPAFAHVDFLVRIDFRFGYGLTPEIVALAATREPSLIVTVDTVYRAWQGWRRRASGYSRVVTDHHLPAPLLPRAEVIVNPPTDAASRAPPLAGVGVAFYVMARSRRSLGQADFAYAELLDLVALGTVADVGTARPQPTAYWWPGLAAHPRGRCVPGIRALLDAAGRRIEQITAADLGFAVARA